MLYLITSKVFTESKHTHTHTHTHARTQMFYKIQKQSPRRVPRKRCFEDMQQIYRKTPMRSVILIKLFCNFIETTLQHGSSPVNLLHIFRTTFLKNTAGWLLLKIIVLKSFGKFKRKHLCWSHFLINLQA